jgi:hypothetical protein
LVQLWNSAVVVELANEQNTITALLKQYALWVWLPRRPRKSFGSLVVMRKSFNIWLRAFIWTIFLGVPGSFAGCYSLMRAWEGVGDALFWAFALWPVNTSLAYAMRYIGCSLPLSPLASFVVFFALGLSYYYLLALLVLWITDRRGAGRYAPSHCMKCKYDLTGNVSGICPECGTPLHRKQAVPEQTSNTDHLQPR